MIGMEYDGHDNLFNTKKWKYKLENILNRGHHASNKIMKQ